MLRNAYRIDRNSSIGGTAAVHQSELMSSGAERASVAPSLLELFNGSILIQRMDKGAIHEDVHLAE